eukprot:scaffold16756_cov101-Isochrysis_galbana.AAC.1
MLSVLPGSSFAISAHLLPARRGTGWSYFRVSSCLRTQCGPVSSQGGADSFLGPGVLAPRGRNRKHSSHERVERCRGWELVEDENTGGELSTGAAVCEEPRLLVHAHRYDPPWTPPRSVLFVLLLLFVCLGLPILCCVSSSSKSSSSDHACFCEGVGGEGVGVGGKRGWACAAAGRGRRARTSAARLSGLGGGGCSAAGRCGSVANRIVAHRDLPAELVVPVLAALLAVPVGHVVRDLRPRAHTLKLHQHREPLVLLPRPRAAVHLLVRVVLSAGGAGRRVGSSPAPRHPTPPRAVYLPITAVTARAAKPS